MLKSYCAFLYSSWSYFKPTSTLPFQEVNILRLIKVKMNLLEVGFPGKHVFGFTFYTQFLLNIVNYLQKYFEGTCFGKY